MREDVDLSGSCTIVLYYDEKFYVRLLRRGEKRTYLTRGEEIPTNALEDLLEKIEFASKHNMKWKWEFGENVIGLDGSSVIAGLKSNTHAEGWTESHKLYRAIRNLLDVVK